MTRAGLLTFALVLMLVTEAWCGQNPNVKVTIHVAAEATRTCEENMPVLNGCEDAVTSLWSEHSPDVFVVFYNLTGYTLLEYGVRTYLSDWEFEHSCSDYVIMDTYEGGVLGVAQFFGSCQPGPVAIPMWFHFWWLEWDQICIVEHPSTGHISAGDCQDPVAIDHAPYVFCVWLGGFSNPVDPCAPTEGPVALDGTTWGEVKALFR